jgi:beta-lactam-binding protein with PASTA domain
MPFSRRPVLLRLLIAFAAAAGAALPALAQEPPPPPPAEEVEVPDLAGLTVDEARAALEKAGLVLGEAAAAPGKGEPGKVLSQNPAKGTKAARGSAVAVEVGAEAAPPPPAEEVEVPDLAGLTVDEARAALEKAGLVLGEATAAPGNGEPGKVLSQNPAKGTKAAKGSAVAVEVGAEAPPPPPAEEVDVPDLAGMTEEEAKAALEAAGLALGTSAKAPGRGQPGKIVSQTPAKGARAAKGTAVNVEVGAEIPVPQTVVPAVVGIREVDARRRIEIAGLKVASVTPRAAPGKGGVVLEQDPPAGTRLPRGSGVSLVVGKEAEVEVPDVRGKTLLDAANALKQVGLKVADTIEYRPDTASAPGTVLEQDPAPGTKIESGSEVRVVISQRSEVLFEVPNVTGKTRAAAEEELRKAGFSAGKVTNAPPPPGTAEGVVLSQAPAAGAKVKAKGPVDLVVSKSPGGLVAVPGLAGLPLAQAEARLKEAGLALGTVERKVKEGEKADTVIAQSLAPGEEVKPGTAVNLVVALEGGESVKVPVVLRKSAEEAAQILQAAGLRVGKVTKGPRYMKEIVIRQSPYPNAKVPRGSEVDLVVTTK